MKEMTERTFRCESGKLVLTRGCEASGSERLPPNPDRVYLRWSVATERVYNDFIMNTEFDQLLMDLRDFNSPYYDQVKGFSEMFLF